MSKHQLLTRRQLVFKIKRGYHAPAAASADRSITIPFCGDLLWLVLDGGREGAPSNVGPYEGGNSSDPSMVKAAGIIS